MSTNIIDLPESLQPVSFLQSVEVELSDKSLEIVDLCKETRWRKDSRLVEQAGQDATRWWASAGRGDRFGSAVALLWVADFYWRNWSSYEGNESELKYVAEYCRDVKNWILEPTPAPSFQRTGTDWPAAISPEELRQKLRDLFGEQDLRDLCFDIRVDYEGLPAEGKAGKARELALYLERRSRIPELIEICSRRRPDVSWGEMAETTRKIIIPASSPTARLIASRTTKGVACYLSGLSYQMLGSMSEASDSYQEALKWLSEASNSYHEALKWFRGAQSGWQHEGNNDRAKAFDRVLEWVGRLSKYVYTIRLDQPSGLKLICPWQHGDREQYAVAELPLTNPITIQNVGNNTPTADFLVQRRREWLWIDGTPIDGYKIRAEESVRVLGVDNSIRSFCFAQPMNPNAQIDGSLVMPAGATYYEFQDSSALSQHQVNNDETIVFERDLGRQVQITETTPPLPPLILGGSDKLDYTLQLTEPPRPPAPPVHILGKQ